MKLLKRLKIFFLLTLIFNTLQTYALEEEKALSANKVNRLKKDKDIIVLDVRKPLEFANGAVPKSLFVGVAGPFDIWVKQVIPNLEQKIIVVGDGKNEKLGITHLSKLGYNNVLGYLDKGFSSWMAKGKPVQKIKNVEVQSYQQNVNNAVDKVFDIRNTNEFSERHLANANNYPLKDIKEWGNQLNKKTNYYIHCASGYRSMIAASILYANGQQNVININGGFKAIQNQVGLKIVK